MIVIPSPRPSEVSKQQPIKAWSDSASTAPGMVTDVKETRSSKADMPMTMTDLGDRNAFQRITEGEGALANDLHALGNHHDGGIGGQSVH